MIYNNNHNDNIGLRLTLTRTTALTAVVMLRVLLYYRICCFGARHELGTKRYTFIKVANIVFLMTNEINITTRSYRSPLIDRANKEVRLVNGKRVSKRYTTHNKRVIICNRKVAVIDTNKERNTQRAIISIDNETKRLNRLREWVKPNANGVFVNDNGINPFEKLVKWSVL